MRHHIIDHFILMYHILVNKLTWDVVIFYGCFGELEVTFVNEQPFQVRVNLRFDRLSIRLILFMTDSLEDSVSIGMSQLLTFYIFH